MTPFRLLFPLEPNRTLWGTPKYKGPSMSPASFVEKLKFPSLPESQKERLKQLMIRTIESPTQSLMHIPELFYRYYNCHQREKANCMITRL